MLRFLSRVHHLQRQPHKLLRTSLVCCELMQATSLPLNLVQLGGMTLNPQQLPLHFQIRFWMHILMSLSLMLRDPPALLPRCLTPSGVEDPRRRDLLRRSQSKQSKQHPNSHLRKHITQLRTPSTSHLWHPSNRHR